MKGLVIWKDGHASLEEMKKPERGKRAWPGSKDSGKA